METKYFQTWIDAEDFAAITWEFREEYLEPEFCALVKRVPRKIQVICLEFFSTDIIIDIHMNFCIHTDIIYGI